MHLWSTPTPNYYVRPLVSRVHGSQMPLIVISILAVPLMLSNARYTNGYID